MSDAHDVVEMQLFDALKLDKISIFSVWTRLPRHTLRQKPRNYHLLHYTTPESG